MSGVPPAAVQAALHARDESQSLTDEGLTRDMLEAAAPLIRADERERIAAYLDHAIRNWRRTRDNAAADQDRRTAACYVDAFQSARSSLLGELLPETKGPS